MVHTFLSGKNASGAAALWMPYVDVRDVAWAHIGAAFNPAAEGRYCAVEKTLKMLEVGAVLARKYKKQPKSEAPKCILYCLGPLVFGITWAWIGENVGIPVSVDNAKIKKDLMESMTPVEKSILEMADAMVASGLVKATPV